MSATEPVLDQRATVFAPPPGWVVAFRPSAGREPGRLSVRSDGAASLRRAERAGCVICFSGILDNRDELVGPRAEPGLDDAQVILEEYSRRGADCIHELRGSFALAIWDSAAERLLCFRDHLGISPLFYADTGEELLLSISIESLLAEPDVDRTPNRLALAERLCDFWPDREQTYFNAIRRVPPGSALSVGPAGRRIYRHWDPTAHHPGAEPLDGDPHELFASRIDQASNLLLRGGRAGIFLSGGIDSVSVAATAAKLSQRQGLAQPLALSIAFRYRSMDSDAVDESDEQRAVATALRMPHVMIDLEQALGGQPVVAAAAELNAQMPAPLDSFWLPAYRQLGALGREQGCGVILDGAGGDEWLSVTPELAADLLRSGRINAALRLWRNQYQSYPVPLLRSFKSVMWKFGIRPLLGDARRRALESLAPGALERRWQERAEQCLPPWLAPDPALRRELKERMIETSRAPRTKDRYLQAVRHSLDHPVVAMQHEEQFLSARDLGISLRHPYLDPDLVSLMLRLPPEVHFSGGRDKGLARAMVAERFPELGFPRKRKVIATSFCQAIFVDEAPMVWKSLAPARALASLGVVDAQMLEEDVTEGFASPDPGRYAVRMWGTLSVESWLRSRI